MKSYKSRCHVWPKPPDQLDWKINLWNHKRRLPEKRSCSPICGTICSYHLPVPYMYIYIYLEPGVNRYTDNILAFGNWRRFQKINREERKIRVHKTNPGNLSWPLIEIRLLAWWYNDVFSTQADCSFEGLWRSEGVYTIHAVTFLQSESQR